MYLKRQNNLKSAKIGNFPKEYKTSIKTKSPKKNYLPALIPLIYIQSCYVSLLVHHIPDQTFPSFCVSTKPQLPRLRKPCSLTETFCPSALIYNSLNFVPCTMLLLNVSIRFSHPLQWTLPLILKPASYIANWNYQVSLLIDFNRIFLSSMNPHYDCTIRWSAFAYVHIRSPPSTKNTSHDQSSPAIAQLSHIECPSDPLCKSRHDFNGRGVNKPTHQHHW